MAVRAVNLRVARRAVLEAHIRLVVERRYAGNLNFTRLRSYGAVALQTELIDLIAFEHLWIA